MNLVLKLFLVVCVFQSVTFAALSGKRRQIVNVIDMELKELSRLSKVSGNKDPEMLLRIAELYLEKGRILREQENEDFFKLPVKTRQRIDRKKFYAKSKSYILKAQKTGLFILKRFSRFRGKSDVYYILAYNEKENVNYKAAKQLFVKSVKTSRRKNSPSAIKSRLSLADIYYSEGNFKQAKANYDAVINRIKDDKWYTKFLYNLSWSNFRLGNKKKAIAQMEQVFKLSRSPKYVDKSKTAQRDLGYFYADKGNLKQAKSFYKRVGGNTAKNFYDMGMFLKDKQKYSKSLNMFRSAYAAGNNDYKVRSLIEMLNIYDKYNNNGKFVIYARKAKEVSLNAEQRKEVLFYISKRAALLQKDLSKSHNINRPGILKQKGSQAAELYIIAQQLDSSLAEKSLFFAAESFYSSNQLDASLRYYSDVKKMGNTSSKYYKRSVIGTLTALNSRKISKKSRIKYFEEAYIEYIKIEPNLEKKGRAVEKLFSFYIDEKKTPSKAESIFFQYSRIYPNKIVKNEAMIGRLVDLYKKKKMKNELFAFVKKLKSTNVRLTKKFVKRLNKIVLTTQFASVQKANSRGDKVYALKGYLTIYSDEESTPSAKRNAAYNIAVLFYELGNMDMMHKWMTRAVNDMNVSEVKSFSKSLSLMVNELYLRNRFNEGNIQSELILRKLCKVNSTSKEKLISNYIVMTLSDGRDEKAKQLLGEMRNCRVNKRIFSSASENFIEYYVDYGLLDKAEREYRNYSVKTKNNVSKIKYLAMIMNKKRERGATVAPYQRSLKSLYRSIKNKSKISRVALDEYAYTRVKLLRSQANNFKSIKLRFPEKKYNKTLQSKFKRLDKITRSGIDILKIGSKKAMVDVYEILIDSYDGFAKDVAAFTPPGKGADYVKSFKKGMTNITNPLNQKVNQFKGELSQQVNKYEVLSDKYGEMARGGIPFVPVHDFVLMDKRGM
jgi:hypothetical protein